MAGRILPVALAAIVGVSIGVATFDREFQDQRRKRLQEDYDQEVAAAAAANSQGSAATVPTPTKSELVQALEAAKKTETAASTPAASDSSWSSMLGLWAWKTEPPQQAASPPLQQPGPTRPSADARKP